VANIFYDSFSTQNSWLLEYFLINAQLFSSITIDSATSTFYSTLLALFLSIFMAIYISCVKDTTPTRLFQFDLGSYFPTEFFYGFIGFLSHSSSQVLSKISTSATSLYTRLQDIISPTHLFNRFVDFLLSCGRSSFSQDPPLLQHPGPFLAVCMETLRHRSALVTLHHQYDSRPKFSDPPIFKTPLVQDPGHPFLKAHFLSPFCALFSLKTLFLSPSPHFRAHFKKTPAFGPFSRKSPVLDRFS
jgi:hypothetical protein